MPKRAPITTREYLKKVPLPLHATTYTVIEHETVIVNALEQLKLKGFTVDSEKYRSNNSGEVAIGVYHLKYKDDPELGMMFAWANSYDKSMRFKCAVGGFVRVSGSSIIADDFSWSRKHTGTADKEMIGNVTNQIMNAQLYYDNIVAVKDVMKETTLSDTIVSEFLGRAFFMKKLFSKEQIGIVRDEMSKPNFDYNAKDDSLWTYYNHMLIALKRAHPRTWMEEQRNLHQEVCKEFGISVKPAVVQAAVALPLVAESDNSLSLDEEITPVVEEMQKMNADHMGIKSDPIEDLANAALAELVTPEVIKKMDDAFKDEIILGKSQTPVTTEPELKPDNSISFLGEDISEEEQRLIDERMAAFGATPTPSGSDLNLPD